MKMSNMGQSKTNETIDTGLEFRKGIFNKDSLKNPLRQIQSLRTKFKERLEEPVEFQSENSNLLYFSKDKNEKGPGSWLQEVSAVTLINNQNVFTGMGQEYINNFWKTMKAENGKTFAEYLNTLEEQMKELESHSK